MPSDFVVGIGNHVSCIMQALISNPYESKFLAEANQKQILCKLSKLAIISDCSLNVNLDYVCHCGQNYMTIAEAVICKMSNILINNYTKSRNDSLVLTKSNKRKLSTLL